MAATDDFRSELKSQLSLAEQQGLPYVEINSGTFHRSMGGYPAAGSHRMPICCNVMYGEQKSGDILVSKPAKGKGASLTIRYRLPR
ncbi:MAG TPA: hypothetical protein VII73_07265 [Caulobacteraceae bacterium]